MVLPFLCFSYKAFCKNTLNLTSWRRGRFVCSMWNKSMQSFDGTHGCQTNVEIMLFGRRMNRKISIYYISVCLCFIRQSRKQLKLFVWFLPNLVFSLLSIRVKGREISSRSHWCDQKIYFYFILIKQKPTKIFCF